MNTLKFTKKFASLTAGFAVVALLALGGTASAIGEGQIEGGNIYRVKNLTKNSEFSDPAYADQCESVQYKVRLHNPGPGVVDNVNVKVSLPAGPSTQNVSTVTITGTNIQPSQTTDTATLNISSSQTVSYASGSTELLDTYSNKLTNLPDGITGNGVNIGTVRVSLNEIRFVQFKANIGCPEVPVQPTYTCDKFSIAAEANRKVKVTEFSTTAKNGAELIGSTITWGDNSNTKGELNPVGLTHQYAADGTYTVTATAHFDVDGKDVTASGANCTQQVTFKGEKPPVVTPPTTPPAGPTKLVNTGPGQVAGIFAAVTAAGTIAYRWMLTRRFGNL